MDANELERLVRRELKTLPVPRAPETLLPRVLAAATERAREAPAAESVLSSVESGPSFVESGFSRIRPGRLARQLVSALALLALAGGVAMFAWAPDAALGGVARFAQAAREGFVATCAFVRDATALTRLVWRVLVEPIAAYLLFLSLLFSLACAAVWTALNRFALGGASRP